jgi:PTH1 family peptidyl-tRNA hydrolase
VSKTATIKLIIGLGNPGDKYSKTRHNAGFWFIDALANRYNSSFKTETKFSGEVAKIAIDGESVWLLKPSTFMNRSGLAAHQISSFYKIPVEQVLVAYDELDLSPGTVRLKKSGGHGGHNGLRDLHAQISKDYMRLRFGIGHPGDRTKVADYVLSRPSQGDEIEINNAIDRALDVIAQIISGDTQKAMNTLHTD